MLNLKELERKLDEALDKETAEDLKEWMRQKDAEESPTTDRHRDEAAQSLAAEFGDNKLLAAVLDNTPNTIKLWMNEERAKYLASQERIAELEKEVSVLDETNKVLFGKVTYYREALTLPTSKPYALVEIHPVKIGELLEQLSDLRRNLTETQEANTVLLVKIAELQGADVELSPETLALIGSERGKRIIADALRNPPSPTSENS